MLAGLSLMPEDEFLEATLPLLQQGEVDCLEWSFDMGWEDPLSDGCLQLLEHFNAHNRLTGHGVSWSLFSAKWTKRHEWWLENLSQEVKKRQYRHISEHFGFMTAGNFHRGSPLPCPLTPELLHLGQERMKRLQEVAHVPCGMENLALAFCLDDVLRQGAFLDALLEPIDGFIVLDLHNLYCQMHNFDVDPLKLMQSYPLHRVQQLHISGGSWSDTSCPTQKIRRDTHDEAVPQEVFQLLPLALQLCPSVEIVIFEHLGHALSTDAHKAQFRKDFLKMKEIVACQKMTPV